MSKTNFAIINKYSRQVVYQGTYPECQKYFISKDKVFRKTHMIKLVK